MPNSNEFGTLGTSFIITHTPLSIYSNVKITCWLNKHQLCALTQSNLIIMWNNTNNALTRTFVFKDFVEAFAFMTRVAFAAERLKHHPEWNNVYNKVTFKLTTHDAGNTVTEKDHELAAAIDKIFG